MKIKRFVARDMRSALTQIKEELGADAVIMSNKKIPEGVELMAAVDYAMQEPPQNNSVAHNTNSSTTSLAEDVVSLGTKGAATEAQSVRITTPVEGGVNTRVEPTFGQPFNEQATVTNSIAEKSMATNPPEAPASDSLAALLSRNVQGSAQSSVQSNIANNAQIPEQGHANRAKQINGTMLEPSIEDQLKHFTDKLARNQTESDLSSQSTDGFTTPQKVEQFNQANQAANSSAGMMSESKAPSNVVGSEEFNQMKAEMASIRQLLEHQVSGLMWQDMAQKDPNRAVLTNKLMALGINEQLADQVAGYVPSHLDENQAWDSALQLLKEQINTTNNDIINRGGVVSVVGPTGVGKTTTLAKLAARFAQIHGAENVVLISTDTYRIGGFEQLETYGKIIGCQVKLAKDAENLESLIGQFSDKKLVLIDTAGMGQRDLRLAEHLAGLVANNRIRIRNYLVLAANTQQQVMQENVERFKKVPLCGCIFTKLDESLSMGEIISTAIQNGLPIGYLTDGQRVPEDIKVANAEKLVSLAEKIVNKSAMKNNINSLRQPMASVAFG